MAVSEFSDGAKEEGVEMTKKDQAGRIADAIVQGSPISPLLANLYIRGSMGGCASGLDRG
jgi:hypothetical protein